MGSSVKMLSCKITEKIINIFQRGIYQWTGSHARPMPWKGIKDPYKIWISEIILQQTRVEQGWPYYQKFIQQFPTVEALGKSSADAVLHLWQGLGYYSRARHLHASAQWIMQQLSGKFPDNYVDLKKLKGVGDYTAAAISSFAFDLPHAVLDGNVHRILSRYFGIKQVMQSTSQKKYFQQLADDLLDKKNPALYNQAIMDFGARCCTPKGPACAICPLNTTCIARQKNAVAQYPPPKIKAAKKIRHFHYFIVVNPGSGIVIRRRTGKDIWKGLYEFPMLETSSSVKPGKTGLKKLFQRPLNPGRPFLVQSQVLSHRIVHGYFYILRSSQIPKDSNRIPLSALEDYPFPRIISKILGRLKARMIPIQ